MLKFLFLVACLFALALGFQWLKDTPGEFSLTIGQTVYVLDLTTAAVAALVAVLLIMALIWFIQELLHAPHRLALGWRRRSAEQGRAAISRGLFAVAAGDVRSAERALADASRRAPDKSLVRLLEAQTAQLKGDRAAARQVFQAMTEERETRVAGLHGLYVEAEREGELEAAHRIADMAREEAPSAPWAARALLKHQIAAGDWDGALRTLSGAADGRVLDKRTARRHRAVILAAKAMDLEIGDPDTARAAALEAHELAPDLVPAAVVAGRLLSRQGDVRRATRILEATWKAFPHPEVADAYLHVRSGDSASDRLRRAEALFRLRSQTDEGRFAVARAAIDAREFDRAREVLTPVLTTRPTQRALVIMAELAEAETGDGARAREWMARALRAPRDPVWTADGMILEAWAPASPVTGRIDAVEWKVPVAEPQAGLQIDAEELKAPLLEPPPEPPEELHEVSAEPEPQAAPQPAAPPPQAAAEPPAPEPAAAPESAPPTGTREPIPAANLGAGSVPPGGNGREARDGKGGNGSGAGEAAQDAGPPLPFLAEPPEEVGPEQPLKPPIPDDPGVGDDEPTRPPPRLYRVH